MLQPDVDVDPDLYRRWQLLEQQPPSRRFDIDTLRAAWWAWTALRRARRDLAATGVTTVVRDPPVVSWGGRTGVYGVLARTSPTCLERCFVAQKWLAAHGIDTTITIGVRHDDQGKVAAHAWIEEEAHPDEYDGFRVIHRIGPPG